MINKIFLLTFLLVLIGCQASGGGEGSSDLVSGHTPVENKFTLTTTLNRTYTVGDTLNIVLSFPKEITVSGGTPSISVTMGALNKIIPMSTTTPKAMVFTYVIAPGDDDTNGISVSSTLSKNGATIKYNSSTETTSTIVVPNLSTVIVNTVGGTAPVANNITPAAFNEDTQSIITLSYSDIDGHLASTCTISSLVKVSVTQACACDAGVCTVGVTGLPHANGAAGFSYRVVANTQSSNIATASLTINPVADLPVAINITPPAFNEDTQSIITLSYTDADNDPGTACAISSPTNVTVTQPCACSSGICAVGVTGTSNYNGAASFNYTVTAGGNVTNSATATLSITAIGDAPVANNISPTAFNEDVQSIITLSYNDTENNLATICAITSPTNVTVSQACECSAGTCTVGVKGTLNYNGSAGFGYTVTAGGQTSNVASAIFTINPVDDVPVASNITPPSFVTNTQSIITLSYSDLESHQASACNISSPTNVTVTQGCACSSGTCTVGVTSTSNYVGAASFQYTVTANGLTSSAATASLTISSGAADPVADDITPPAFNEEVQSIITLSYTDPNSDQATACSISNETNVTVTQGCACSAGTCTVGVTGLTDYFGAASFDYTVTANGDVSNTAEATLTINNVDDAPVAAAITPPAFNENAQSIITLSYSDVDNDQANACAITGQTNVTVTQACACSSGTCTVGVTGTLNYNGAASFNYTVTANSVVSNSATATLTINPVDNAPIADNITPPAFNEDVQSIITLSYSDVESDQATTCAISSPLNVTETQACACSSGTCTVGVKGTAHYNGAAGFTYTVTANSAVSNSASATLTINAVDDAPVADDITPPAFNKNAQSIITLSYTDVDLDPATTCTISGETNVSVTQACACSAGSCTVGVTGDLNYFGPASFDYTVTANSIASNSATATLTINNIDNAPVAQNIIPPAFNEDVESTITLSYTDVDSDNATSCTLSSLNNVTESTPCACSAGTCTVGVTGSANYNGSASFGYTVTANSSSSNGATATLTINAVPDAPVAQNITPAAFDEDTASTINLTYTDAEGDFADSCAVSNLTNVTVTSACTCTLGSCSLEVKGTTDYNGTAGFTYTVTANSQTSNSATASLTISGVDDAPVATNITPTAASEDVQKLITLSYTDKESHAASTCTITSPNNVSVTQACACSAGTCTVGVTGSLNYSGAAGFGYTVTANGLTSNTATSNFTITAVNDAPVISAIGNQTTSMNSATGSIAFTITDVDSTLTCSAVRLAMTSTNTTLVSNSSVTWSGTAPNCSAVITPNTNQSGTTAITFTVNDGAGGSTPGNFNLTVNGVLLVWTNSTGTVITSHDFGDPNTDATFNAYVKNIGNQTSGTVTITDNNGSNRIGHTGTCTTLAAGVSCPITINWQDMNPSGLKTETFTASDGVNPSTTLTVTGTK